jgi:thioredoxin reductase (NADPH)
MHLSRHARRVTLLVRGASLESGMSRYLIETLVATPNVDVRLRTDVSGGEGRGRLERIVLRDVESGAESTVPAAALFVLIGAHPHTDWLPSDIECDERGFVLTGGDLADRTAAPLATSRPGVFAVGDVRHRSVKRVASAVGEGSGAVQHVHRYLARSERDGAVT